jgi:putative spermidine/putrescine transport system ATP-binding protein
MSFVSLRGLEKKFGQTAVFNDIDLNITQGTICVIVGPSGCGKTTLLRAVAGLTAPDKGQIFIDGRDVTGTEAKHRGIGMVFQHYALFPNMTVRQNLSFGLEQMKLPTSEIARKVSGMIELVGLGPRAEARPAALSGGQKQRVALARALVLEPKLLLLDEPLSALDAQIRKRLREEMKRLQRQVGFTAIFVTHDQEEALLLGDQICVMQSGRFEQIGSPADIYNRPKTLSVAKFIGDFNILEPKHVAGVFGDQTNMIWAIHPQAFEINADKKKLNGTAVHAEAVVKTVSILGTVLRYTFASGDHLIKVDVLNRPELRALQPGEPARISVARANLLELPA